MPLQLFSQRRVAHLTAMQHHEGLHQLGAFGVRLADHGRFDHGRMLHECALDIERPDAVTGRRDDIVGAAHEADATVIVQLHRVAAQVIVADKRLGPRPHITREPEQRRTSTVQRQHARFAWLQLALLVIQDHDPMPWHGISGRSDTDAMAQCVMVTEHHAEFGLAIMIMDRAAKAAAEPADNLGRERFARAAHGAQTSLDRAFHLAAGRQQQAECGRRPCHVGDAVLAHHTAGTVHRETAFVEQRAVPHGQRPGDGVVQAIRPARIGDVPEVVFGPKVHCVPHVSDECHDGLERHVQLFRGSGGA